MPQAVFSKGDLIAVIHSQDKSYSVDVLTEDAALLKVLDKVGEPLTYHSTLFKAPDKQVTTTVDEYLVALQQYLEAEGLIMDSFTEESLSQEEEVIDIDEDEEDADWLKTMFWDLPPYKSPDFMSVFADENGGLAAFKESVLYKSAVKGGLIKDDEWAGSAEGYEVIPQAD